MMNLRKKMLVKSGDVTTSRAPFMNSDYNVIMIHD